MNIKVTRTRLALVVAVLGIVVAGVSYAGIPAANGTISACKDPKGGLKVIDAESGQSCSGNQQLLTWNQQGAPGVSGYEIVSFRGDTGNNDTRWTRATCPAGKEPVGGGGRTYIGAGTYFDAAISASHPEPEFRSWRVEATRIVETGTSTPSWGVDAYVVCATVN